MASSSESLPNSIFHSIQHRLSASNYLVWLNQMLVLFEFQDLLSHVDGTSVAPAATIEADGKSSPNPLFTAWKDADRKAIILLNSSLSEEAFTEVIGFETAREKWLALERVYSNPSMDRVQNLRDQLQSITKGSSTVAEFGKRFKSLVDQLAAIGHPVDESDKTHWFYRGLGPSFETFSIALKTARPDITLRDLQSQAESNEFFSRTIHGSQPPPAAFTAQQNLSQPPKNRDNRSGGRFNSRSNRSNNKSGRSDPCQWCGKKGHKANRCYLLLNQTTATSPVSTAKEAQIAQAFKAQCNISTSSPDWHVDSGATDHMVGSSSHTVHSVPFTGPRDETTFGPGTM